MKKMKILLLILLGILLVTNVTFAARKIFVVDPGLRFCVEVAAQNEIQNHTTIQYAVNNASYLAAGDTAAIFVCANGTGHYSESVVVNASVNISNNAPSGLAIYINSSNVNLPIFNITARDVNLSVFELANATGAPAIFINSTAHYTKIYSVNISNSKYGISIWNSSNTRIDLCPSITNTSAIGIFINLSNYNNITRTNVFNHTGKGIAIYDSNYTSIFFGSRIYVNNYSGIYGERLNNTFINNTSFYNNSNGAATSGAIDLTNDYGSNISLNTLWNNYRSIVITASTQIIRISNNTLHNDSVCSICLYGVNYAIISDNNISNSTNGTGVVLSIDSSGIGSLFNNITNTRTFNNTLMGVYLLLSHNNTLQNVTSFNNSIDGFNIYRSNNNTIIYSNASYNVKNGFVLTNSNLTNFTHNNIHHNDLDGFEFLGGTTVTFTSNNLTNNLNAGIFIANDGVLNFSGNNDIHTVNDDIYTVYVVYLDGGTMHTGTNNITTDHLNFGFNDSRNISIRVLNFTANGMTSVAAVSGNIASAGKIVKSAQSQDHWLNVSNTSSNVATFTPTLYYDTTDTSGFNSNYIIIGTNTGGGNGWSHNEVIRDTERGSLLSTVTISMSSSSKYFATIVWTPADTGSSGTNTGGSSGSKSYVSVSSTSTSFDGTTNKLTVTLDSSLNSGTLKLIDETAPILPTQTAIISGGKAVFTIYESGTYSIVDDVLPSGYSWNLVYTVRIRESDLKNAATEVPGTGSAPMVSYGGGKITIDPTSDIPDGTKLVVTNTETSKSVYVFVKDGTAQFKPKETGTYEITLPDSSALSMGKSSITIAALPATSSLSAEVDKQTSKVTVTLPSTLPSGIKLLVKDIDGKDPYIKPFYVTSKDGKAEFTITESATYSITSDSKSAVKISPMTLTVDLTSTSDSAAASVDSATNKVTLTLATGKLPPGAKFLVKETASSETTTIVSTDAGAGFSATKSGVYQITSDPTSTIKIDPILLTVSIVPLVESPVLSVDKKTGKVTVSVPSAVPEETKMIVKDMTPPTAQETSVLVSDGTVTFTATDTGTYKITPDSSSGISTDPIFVSVDTSASTSQSASAAVDQASGDVAVSLDVPVDGEELIVKDSSSGDAFSVTLEEGKAAFTVEPGTYEISTPPAAYLDVDPLVIVVGEETQTSGDGSTADEELKEEAEETLDEALLLIEEAEKKGENVADAQIKYSGAQQAFDNANYVEAIKLAEEVKKMFLASGDGKSPVAPIIPPTPLKPEDKSIITVLFENVVPIAFGGAILIVAAGALYYFWHKRGKKY